MDSSGGGFRNRPRDLKRQDISPTFVPGLFASGFQRSRARSWASGSLSTERGSETCANRPVALQQSSGKIGLQCLGPHQGVTAGKCAEQRRKLRVRSQRLVSISVPAAHLLLQHDWLKHDLTLVEELQALVGDKIIRQRSAAAGLWKNMCKAAPHRRT